MKGRGYTATVESKSREHYLDTGAAEPVKEIELALHDSLSKRYSWNDLHRFAWKIANLDGDLSETRKNVLAFAEIYGDLFI